VRVDALLMIVQENAVVEKRYLFKDHIGNELTPDKGDTTGSDWMRSFPFLR
jgi:hypothetical protein